MKRNRFTVSVEPNGALDERSAAALLVNLEVVKVSLYHVCRGFYSNDVAWRRRTARRTNSCSAGGASSCMTLCASVSAIWRAWSFAASTNAAWTCSATLCCTWRRPTSRRKISIISSAWRRASTFARSRRAGGASRSSWSLCPTVSGGGACGSHLDEVRFAYPHGSGLAGLRADFERGATALAAM